MALNLRETETRGSVDSDGSLALATSGPQCITAKLFLIINLTMCVNICFTELCWHRVWKLLLFAAHVCIKHRQIFSTAKYCSGKILTLMSKAQENQILSLKDKVRKWFKADEWPLSNSPSNHWDISKALKSTYKNLPTGFGPASETHVFKKWTIYPEKLIAFKITKNY